MTKPSPSPVRQLNAGNNCDKFRGACAFNFTRLAKLKPYLFVSNTLTITGILSAEHLSDRKLT